MSRFQNFITSATLLKLVYKKQRNITIMHAVLDASCKKLQISGIMETLSKSFCSVLIAWDIMIVNDNWVCTGCELYVTALPSSSDIRYCVKELFYVM